MAGSRFKRLGFGSCPMECPSHGDLGMGSIYYLSRLCGSFSMPLFGEHLVQAE